MSLRPSRRLMLITRREFRERVTQRSYRITLILGALAAALAVAAPALLKDTAGGDGGAPVAVTFTAGDAAARFTLLRSDAITPSGGQLRFANRPNPEAVRASVRRGDAPLGLVIGGSAAAPTVLVVAREDGGGTTLEPALAAVQRATDRARAQAAGLDTGAANAVSTRVASRLTTVSGSGPSGASAAVAFVLAMLVYVSILTLVQSAATGLVADRKARVTERLLTAASPREHLFGKLIGVGASGLLQLAAWLLAAVVANAAASGSGAEGVLSQAPTALLVCFPLAVIGGYLLYAAVATLLILPVDKPEDAGGAALPGLMLLIIAIVLTTSIIPPGSTVSPAMAALSLVPFFSPLLMLARAAGGEVPLWELAIGMAGPFLLAALLLLWVAPAYARHAIEPASGKGLAAAFDSLRPAR